jgi:hypothetical protein
MMSDKFPFLAEQSIGRGVHYAFTSGFSSKWSEFPLTNSFLPVIREIVAGNPSREIRKITALNCGEKIPDEFSSPSPPPGNKTETAVMAESPGLIISPDGVPLEINVPRLESVTQRQSLGAILSKADGAGSTVKNKPAAEGSADPASTGNLWVLLAVAAALAVLLENICANLLDARPAASQYPGEEK